MGHCELNITHGFKNVFSFPATNFGASKFRARSTRSQTKWTRLSMHDIQLLPGFGHRHGVSFKDSESCNGFHWRSPSVFMSLYQIIYARSLKSSSVINLLSLPVYTVYVLALLWLVNRGPIRVSPRLSFWMIILHPIMSFISKHIRQNTGFHCILLPFCTIGVLHWFSTTLASKYVADICNNNGQCNGQQQ